METVDVSVQIKAPLEKVFSMLVDHEGYGNLMGMKSVKLLKSGEIEQNGKGAVRQFESPMVTFIEEISLFEKNQCYEYKVLECFIDLGFTKLAIPLIHEIGRVSLEQQGDSILVRWISRIEIDIPVTKEMASKIFSFAGSRSFLFILSQMKYKLESN